MNYVLTVEELGHYKGKTVDEVLEIYQYRHYELRSFVGKYYKIGISGTYFYLDPSYVEWQEPKIQIPTITVSKGPNGIIVNISEKTFGMQSLFCNLRSGDYKEVTKEEFEKNKTFAKKIITEYNEYYI